MAPRPIHLASMDKVRPVLVLTRPEVRYKIERLTVAVITTNRRNLSCEVPVDATNGLDEPSVVNCDNIQTILRGALLDRIGELHPDQEVLLTEAIKYAYDLGSHVATSPT